MDRPNPVNTTFEQVLVADVPIQLKRQRETRRATDRGHVKLEPPSLKTQPYTMERYLRPPQSKT